MYIFVQFTVEKHVKSVNSRVPGTPGKKVFRERESRAWLPKPVSVVSGANGRIDLGLVFTGRIDHRIYALFDANSHNLRLFEK